MVKDIKRKLGSLPPGVAQLMRKGGHVLGGVNNKNLPTVTNTEQAVEYFLSATRNNLRTLRAAGGDILALQSLTYLFSGNPVALFAHRLLAEEALSTAESVRQWCLGVFKSHGGTGPEVIDRVIGPERQALMAAHQALARFTQFVEHAGKVMRESEAPEPPPGFDADKQARRAELIKAGSERELTPDEHQELMALRAEFRAAMIAGAPPHQAGATVALSPEAMREAARSDEELAAHAVDTAMASGALEPWPETTSRERARELYIAACGRDLTPEERTELGLIDGADAVEGGQDAHERGLPDVVVPGDQAQPAPDADAQGPEAQAQAREEAPGA